MARAVQPGEVGVPVHRHHFTLNTDGQRHPRENSALSLAVVLAAVAAVCIFIPPAHTIGSWAGLLGLFAAGWAQMISATTAERLVNVTAAVLAGLGLLFGLAHGGLY